MVYVDSFYARWIVEVHTGPNYLRAATSSNGTTLACQNSEQFYDFYGIVMSV